MVGAVLAIKNAGSTDGSGGEESFRRSHLRIAPTTLTPSPSSADENGALQSLPVIGVQTVLTVVSLPATNRPNPLNSHQRRIPMNGGFCRFFRHVVADLHTSNLAHNPEKANRDWSIFPELFDFHRIECVNPLRHSPSLRIRLGFPFRKRRRLPLPRRQHKTDFSNQAKRVVIRYNTIPSSSVDARVVCHAGRGHPAYEIRTLIVVRIVTIRFGPHARELHATN